jgi:hypothetical protein
VFSSNCREGGHDAKNRSSIGAPQSEDDPRGVEEGGAIASLLPYTVVITKIDGTGAHALSFAFCYAGNCVEAGPGKDDGVSRWIVVAPIVRMMDPVCRFLGSVVLARSLVRAAR